MNSAISSLTFMFRTEIQEVVDMELKNYTIQKVFCHKNSNRETDSEICLSGSRKEKASFLMMKKGIEFYMLNLRCLFVVAVVLFLFIFLFSTADFMFPDHLDPLQILSNLNT